MWGRKSRYLDGFGYSFSAYEPGYNYPWKQDPNRLVYAFVIEVDIAVGDWPEATQSIIDF